jgi:hypothetical protein
MFMKLNFRGSFDMKISITVKLLAFLIMVLVVSGCGQSATTGGVSGGTSNSGTSNSGKGVTHTNTDNSSNAGNKPSASNNPSPSNNQSPSNNPNGGNATSGTGGASVVHDNYSGNIALKYAIATQATTPSYPYYKAPSLVIDGDLDTFNHTEGDSEKNYLQLELPKTTLVTKIIIHPRAGFPGRTKDIKIYSSLSHYKGDLSTFTQIATLSSS